MRLGLRANTGQTKTPRIEVFGKPTPSTSNADEPRFDRILLISNNWLQSIRPPRAANRHSNLIPALRSLCHSRALFGPARLHTLCADEYDRVVASTPSQIVV
jgi:hypothetical protein